VPCHFRALCTKKLLGLMIQKTPGTITVFEVLFFYFYLRDCAIDVLMVKLYLTVERLVQSCQLML